MIPNQNWNNFYQLTKDRAPRPQVHRAMELLGRTGEALDMGCGAGADTRSLVAQGFHVTAFDREAAALEALADLPPESVERVQSSFEDFPFARYDLINAQFALPFITPDHFPVVFARLKAALNPGGIFVGQLFGKHDTWNVPENRMTFVTCEEALAQLAGLEILEFEEEDHDGATADGSIKHWHVYHIIARKP